MFKKSKKLEGAGQVGNDTAMENTPLSSVRSCCVCGTKENVKRCGGCKLVSYCSKGCQKQHFDYHSKYCMAISDLQELEVKKLYGNYSVREEQLDFRNKAKIMKLVGEKPMVNCYLDGKNFEMLWDTGSMVSLVDRKWVEKNFPDKEIYAVNDFLENRSLNVQAANSSEIKFDGVVLLNFSLNSGNNEGFLVPVLVATHITEPILGYNVIEHLIINGTAEKSVTLESLESLESLEKHESI